MIWLNSPDFPNFPRKLKPPSYPWCMSPSPPTDNWIEALLLEYLPVPAEIVLEDGVIHQKEVLDVGHFFLEAEVLPGRVKVEKRLFQVQERERV